VQLLQQVQLPLLVVAAVLVLLPLVREVLGGCTCPHLMLQEAGR
jgi:hypothetical protein